MDRWKCVVAAAIGSMVVTGADAQTRTAIQGPSIVNALQGYRCMELNLREDQGSWDDLPPVYAEPSGAAPRIGIATNTVIVAEPRREQNGFIAVLHMDGRPGWLDARMVRPWVNRSNPSTLCHPAMMSNGRPGFAYTRPRG